MRSGMCVPHHLLHRARGAEMQRKSWGGPRRWGSVEGDPLQHLTRFQGRLPVVLTGLLKANGGHGRRPRTQATMPPAPEALPAADVLGADGH